jgi:hypothetical protein
MAISLASLRRSNVVKPMRSLIYGTHGVGKTTLAANAPNPVFIQTEDGLMTDTPTFGLLRSYEEVSEAMGSLYTEDHDFSTVVLDTLDWLEPLIWAEACKRGNWSTIEDAGYGKGYLAASTVWREFLDGTNALRDEKGMTVILLAHADIKRFESPETEPFDRYTPKLHKLGSALVQENVDCIFFANRMVTTVKIDPKDKNSRVRGVGGGQRVLYTEERPAYLAKNRYSMPSQILLPDNAEGAWSSLAQEVPFFNLNSSNA